MFSQLEIFLCFLMSLSFDLPLLRLMQYKTKERHFAANLLLKETFTKPLFLGIIIGISGANFLIASFSPLLPLIQVLALSLLPFLLIKSFLFLSWYKTRVKEGQWAFQLLVPFTLITFGFSLLPIILFGVPPLSSRSFSGYSTLLLYFAVGIPMLAAFFSQAVIQRTVRKFLVPAFPFTIVPGVLNRVAQLTLGKRFLPILLRTPIIAISIITPISITVWLVMRLFVRRRTT